MIDSIKKKKHTSQLLFEILSAGARAVLLNPVGGVLDGRQEGLLVVITEFPTETFLIAELVLETVDEGGERVEGLDPLALSLILSGELLGLGDHAVDFFLAKTSLLVGDGDRLGFATRKIKVRYGTQNLK